MKKQTQIKLKGERSITSHGFKFNIEVGHVPPTMKSPNANLFDTCIDIAAKMEKGKSTPIPLSWIKRTPPKNFCSALNTKLKALVPNGSFSARVINNNEGNPELVRLFCNE